MLNEEWENASVLGLSNYLCSNLGKIINISRNKLLKINSNNDVITYKLLNDDHKYQQIRAHILISKLFKIPKGITILQKEIVDNLIDDYQINLNNNYVWVPILVFGFERHKICEEGKILSIKGDIMKTYVKNNTIKISLSNNDKDSKRSKFRVCILVASTFIDNPNKFKCIKFKDGNSLNVNKNNLEWVDNIFGNSFPKDEIWKPLIGFPKYEINPRGIRNVTTHKILTPQMSTEYPGLNLYIDNDTTKHLQLHIAMAKQYVHNPDPDNLIEVNHKNGIKDDFSIENLEWVTHIQNVQHAVDTGLTPKNIGNCKNIELLDETLNVINTFLTVDKAGEHIKCSGKIIKDEIKSNKLGNKTAIINGYILRYKICVDLDGEIWKNVNTDYLNINNKYKISNYGRLKNDNDKLFIHRLSAGGYEKVNLTNYIKTNGSRKNKNEDKTFYVHILVAYAFLEFVGDKNDYQVNHNDKNRRNNHLDNLEILTVMEHNRKDHGKSVLCVTKNNKYYIFGSQGEAGDYFKTDKHNIYLYIKNKTNPKNHLFYHYDSKEAQDIIYEFQSKGINVSIPPKIEIVPKRKSRFIIVS